ncbi:MAG: hypothetical protein LBG81_05150 [Coriobacteriaceae bacterium]|jgi:hypothetical protein|nr:hypothetical protein [Coriobacteriaceae bacterium]
MGATSYEDIERALECLEEDVLKDQERLAARIEELSRAQGGFQQSRLCAADTSGAANEASERYSRALEALHGAGRALGTYTAESLKLREALKNK